MSAEIVSGIESILTNGSLVVPHFSLLSLQENELIPTNALRYYSTRAEICPYLCLSIAGFWVFLLLYQDPRSPCKPEVRLSFEKRPVSAYIFRERLCQAKLHQSDCVASTVMLLLLY